MLPERNPHRTPTHKYFLRRPRALGEAFRGPRAVPEYEKADSRFSPDYRHGRRAGEEQQTPLPAAHPFSISALSSDPHHRQQTRADEHLGVPDDHLEPAGATRQFRDDRLPRLLCSSAAEVRSLRPSHQPFGCPRATATEQPLNAHRDPTWKFYHILFYSLHIEMRPCFQTAHGSRLLFQELCPETLLKRIAVASRISIARSGNE